MSNRVLALLSALVATIFFGINHTLAKGLMPDYIQPYGLVFLRVLGAGVLFWIVSLFIKNETIELRHWPRLLASAVCGMFLNMQLSFKGLSLSTPINSSVLVTITPILVFVLSAVLIREKITILKASGVILGLLGGLSLILFGVQEQVGAPNIPLGNVLLFINSIAFGLFLIISKPLTVRYHPITLMRWLFLTAIIVNLPIGWTEFRAIEWSEMPFSIGWRVAFVILCTTFATYLLNMYALKYLSASTIGSFTYLQPVIAIAFAIYSGADQLTFIKIISTILVIVGVFMVSKNPAIKRART